MLETRPGVYFWQAPHPEWIPDDGWDRVVTSYALDDGEQLVVIDPLAPPGALDELAANRSTAIVVTCSWHVRDSERLARRLGIPLYMPPPSADQENPASAIVYTAGEPLPVGLEAFRGLEDSDLVLWSETHAAVIAGDTFIDRGDGLIFPMDWAARRGDPEPMKSSLMSLLDREIDVVLPTHGLPTDRAALEFALSHG